jgi:hypothetical protein
MKPQIDKMKNQLEVKVDLCHKYERLAKVASSKRKRKKFLSKADKYRRQAKDLIHESVLRGWKQAKEMAET